MYAFALSCWTWVKQSRNISILLGVVLVAAGIPKVREPWMFYRIVQSYQVAIPLVPELVATYLPWVEVVCGTALLVGFARRGALLVSTVMFTVLFGALSVSLARGLIVDCGCFGVHGGGQIGLVSVVRAFILAFVASVAMASEIKGQKASFQNAD